MEDHCDQNKRSAHQEASFETRGLLSGEGTDLFFMARTKAGTERGAKFQENFRKIIGTLQENYRKA